MEKTHLFAGIFIDNTQAYATVMNQKGQALLCNQYRYERPENNFVEIVEHLRAFADFHHAPLLITFTDRWGNPLQPVDFSDPLYENILILSHHDIAQANLPFGYYGPNSQYDKPKLLALLGALRLAAPHSIADNYFPFKAGE